MCRQGFSVSTLASPSSHLVETPDSQSQAQRPQGNLVTTTNLFVQLDASPSLPLNRSPSPSSDQQGLGHRDEYLSWSDRHPVETETEDRDRKTTARSSRLTGLCSSKSVDDLDVFLVFSYERSRVFDSVSRGSVLYPTYDCFVFSVLWPKIQNHQIDDILETHILPSTP